MSRRTKLTRERIETLAGYVANGCTNRDAARLSGIAESTLYHWLGIAREHEHEGRTRTLPVQLARALEEAEAGFRRAQLEVIRRAATEPTIEIRTRTLSDGTTETIRTERPPSWQPAAWLLERKYPGEYGRRLEHSDAIKSEAKSEITLKVPCNGRRLIHDEGECMSCDEYRRHKAALVQ